ncbi:MAG: hypothetical protein MJ172_06975 [Clostridia bacterium]|nr:hypothetical protein [Clostridia bacterium]
MNDKNKKIKLICDIITVVFGILALILQLAGGGRFNDPFIWILIVLVISSISSLITILNSK